MLIVSEGFSSGLSYIGCATSEHFKDWLLRHKGKQNNWSYKVE